MFYFFPSLFSYANKENSYSTTYDNCLDQAVSTLDMRKCIKAELVYQDKVLNKNYHTLMRRLNPDQKNMLRDAQRVWITYRDKSCALHRDMGSGGTIDLISGDQCYLDLTKQRAGFLEFFLGIH